MRNRRRSLLLASLAAAGLAAAAWRYWPERGFANPCYLNAGCAHGAPGRIDASYIERMHNLIDGMRRGFMLLLLAFDRHFNDSGEPSWDETSFYVPDAYAHSSTACASS